MTDTSSDHPRPAVLVAPLALIVTVWRGPQSFEPMCAGWARVLGGDTRPGAYARPRRTWIGRQKTLGDWTPDTTLTRLVGILQRIALASTDGVIPPMPGAPVVAGAHKLRRLVTACGLWAGPPRVGAIATGWGRLLGVDSRDAGPIAHEAITDRTVAGWADRHGALPEGLDAADLLDDLTLLIDNLARTAIEATEEGG